MRDFLNKKVLITTSSWFYGKDGRQYRAVYGTLKAVHEIKNALGFIPNRAHANWVIEIGSMVIMGCQVMYIEQTDEMPPQTQIKDWYMNDGKYQEYERDSAVYLTS